MPMVASPNVVCTPSPGVRDNWLIARVSPPTFTSRLTLAGTYADPRDGSPTARVPPARAFFLRLYFQPRLTASTRPATSRSRWVARSDNRW